MQIITLDKILDNEIEIELERNNCYSLEIFIQEKKIEIIRKLVKYFFKDSGKFEQERASDKAGRMSSGYPSDCNFYSEGMSLRDWFAGMAITGEMLVRGSYNTTHNSVAEEAYKLADAMLKKREK